ncbi:fatty acid desaturase family protein [Burkholderia ambifaria]|uniref:Fatty acid desaturase n=1 Tax=Burkholderia ambifaria TaxID=152480 RepID=A0AA41JIJ5_9BURK|nr:fatty acid desaturase [Burkholderia ambifaria]MBR8128813.1 fatty acid desaturase [Burkholderia ambifaria]PRE01422.1 fatty acid desaturase [Burkholderia ambifaria]
MTIEATLDSDLALSRLKLPRHFHRISSVATILYLAHALAFFLIPAAVAFAVVDIPASTPTRIAMAIVLGVIGGHGMHLLTFVGHEGMHTNLHRNKYVSAALALICSSLVPGFLIVGFSMTHWKHHRFTGQDIDPDVQIYSQYRTFWSRFFLARSTGVRIYLKNAMRMAAGLPWPENTRLPFSQREMRWISRLNVALNLCAVTTYGFIWHRSVWLGFTVMLIPYIGVYVFSTIRAYIEHTDTVPGRYRDSRSYTSPIYTALFFGSNYHLEHHQYPAVPCYRLPALHAYLASHGLFEGTGAQVEPSFLGALRYTTGRFQYPCVNLQSATDEFLERMADGRLDRDAATADVRDGDALVAVARK